MEEARLYLTFGFSSIVGYAEKHFPLSRSQTYEFLRVGDHRCPECRSLYR